MFLNLQQFYMAEIRSFNEYVCSNVLKIIEKKWGLFIELINFPICTLVSVINWCILLWWFEKKIPQAQIFDYLDPNWESCLGSNSRYGLGEDKSVGFGLEVSKDKTYSQCFQLCLQLGIITLSCPKYEGYMSNGFVEFFSVMKKSW